MEKNRIDILFFYFRNEGKNYLNILYEIYFLYAFCILDLKMVSAFPMEAETVIEKGATLLGMSDRQITGFRVKIRRSKSDLIML